MLIKTEAMNEMAIDWAVAKIERKITGPDNPLDRPQSYTFRPSTDGGYAAAIIEREKISVMCYGDFWSALPWNGSRHMRGPTMLTAAMLAYVKSKLGDEIDVPEAIAKLMPQPSVEKPASAPGEFAIPAEAHSDDHVVSVAFDAVSWFVQADDSEISSLVSEGWRGDEAADAVFLHIQETNDEAEALMDYVHVLRKSGRYMGFECSVDAESAARWIVENRPALAEQLSAEEEWPTAVNVASDSAPTM